MGSLATSAKEWKFFIEISDRKIFTILDGENFTIPGLWQGFI